MLPRNITMLQRSPRVGGDVMKFAPKSSLAGREGLDSGLVVCGVVQAICKKKGQENFGGKFSIGKKAFYLKMSFGITCHSLRQKHGLLRDSVTDY